MSSQPVVDEPNCSRAAPTGHAGEGLTTPGQGSGSGLERLTQQVQQDSRVLAAATARLTGLVDVVRQAQSPDQTPWSW